MQIIQRERANVGNYSSQVQFAVSFAGFCSVHDCKERFIQNLVKQADKTVHNYVKTREDMLYSHISIIGRSNGISDLLELKAYSSSKLVSKWLFRLHGMFLRLV